MNVLNQQEHQSFLRAERDDLLGEGFGALREFAAEVQALRVALDDVKSIADTNTCRRIDRLDKQLNAFEPSVTLIGQIKSGKTSLVNALIGAPDLLPADVNPWTSVVTSLHLHPESADVEECAAFQFFDAQEWDRLVTGGGRMGELASRAGAATELQKIKEQVEQMREKSRERLGRKFEMLLGQRREYGYIDAALIERFVCLGEDFDDDSPESDTEAQGRFADITKSADLTMRRGALPIRLCIRDTPGVNDTFMMREQVTIRAIRDSRICVVVLSANQALSSTDLALIRLIANVKSRDVIIFVNRVDELSNPDEQIPIIRESILETLKKHKGPKDAPILFGSALWASFALKPGMEDIRAARLTATNSVCMDQDSVTGQPIDSGSPSRQEIWRQSGIPKLQLSIASRIVDGPGAFLLQKTGSSGHNLISGLAAANRTKDRSRLPGASTPISAEVAWEALDLLASQQRAELNDAYNSLILDTQSRMIRAQESFLDRATTSLISHLEIHGEDSLWTYDPSGFRVLLSSAHQVFARKSRALFDRVAADTVKRIQLICADACPVGSEALTITAPPAPPVPAPVSLGRTIALDLSSSWWQRWWRLRRGYKAYTESFRDLIRTETTPVIMELTNELAQGVKSDGCKAFDAFLDEQFTVFRTLKQSEYAKEHEDVQSRGIADTGHKRAVLKSSLDVMGRFAKP